MKINSKKGKTNYLNQKGITLIALVVTIVVLLILAGVSINVLFSDSGIIKRAKNAQTKMDQAKQNELDTIDELNDWVDSKTNRTTEGGTTIKSYEETEKDANKNGVLKENAIYTDSEDATVTIPKGFKVSNVVADDNSAGEQTVSKGLVIQDEDENEFVWVPVDYTATETLDSDGLDSGFKDKFKRTNSNDENYLEPYENGYQEEKEDYIKMMKSVQKNKGFYIGRYEAGTVEPRTRSITTSSDIVVKRDAYPYIYVGWGNETNNITSKVIYNNQEKGEGAVYLSKHMYDNKDIGATSTLCYGVQWDATMRFVSSTHRMDYSTTWGNYQNSKWTITRTTASYSDDARRNL